MQHMIITLGEKVFRTGINDGIIRSAVGVCECNHMCKNIKDFFSIHFLVWVCFLLSIYCLLEKNQHIV